MSRQVRIPNEKVAVLVSKLTQAAERDKLSLREIQSVIGSFNFVCKVISAGRAFMRRLINLTKKATRPHHMIRLTKGARADMLVWLEFLAHFNGTVFFQDPGLYSHLDIQFFHGCSR